LTCPRQGAPSPAPVQELGERLWVITTNDNVDALRFYQRYGFCLAAVHRGAVDRSRARLKPEIPPVGAYGIPLCDGSNSKSKP
jgi:hypothetical protein